MEELKDGRIEVFLHSSNFLLNFNFSIPEFFNF